MPKLSEQINQNLKQAMKNKDAVTLSILRMLIAAMRNKEISLRRNGKEELTDNQIVEVISSEIKKRRDSAVAYEQGKRQDLVDQETGEIKILERYLPAQLSDMELEKIIREIIAATPDLPVGLASFGKVMSQAVAKTKGKADGAKVNELVKKLLAK